jgi:hypothetical protein
MTTIAYQRSTKTIGVDSKNTDSTGAVFLVNKIERLTDGRFFLGSGHLLTINQMYRWADVNFLEDRRPDFSELVGENADDYSSSCIIISKDGSIVSIIDDEMTPYVVEDDIITAGSGGSVARGALAAGATMEEAINIAIKYDSNSGGPVRTHVIGES